MTTDDACPVLTNAEWLHLTSELSDLDLLQLERGAHDIVSAVALCQLADLVYDRHTDEVCTHCTTHLEGPKTLSPSNPACEGRWCSRATLDWLSAPCAEPDDPEE